MGVHQDKVASIAWSRDGTRLLTASFDSTARVWPAAPT
nr:WD40 repeat domain-containing protein [Streptomyces dysideae]